MKKKLMAFVLAVVLCFGMTATVMAAYEEKEVVIETTASADYEVWEYTGEEVSMADVMWYLDECTDLNLSYQDVLYCRDFGFDFEDGYTVPESGIQITFTDENISANKSYVMIGVYWKIVDAANSQYELIARQLPASAGTGKITCTYTLPEIDEIYYIEVKSSGAGAPSPSVDAPVVAPAGPTEITFTGTNGTAMNWITSKENGNISVSGSQANLPEGAEFNVSKLVDGTEALRAANAVVKAKGDVNYAIYDFNLTTADGQPLTRFNGHVDITMLIPNGLSTANGKVISVYYVTNTGKLERCNSVIDGAFITFGTSHLSTFVYVEETPESAAAYPIVNGVTSPKTADTNFVLYMSVLGLAALGMAAYTIGKTKYNK